jgi:hypothetical protein
MNGKNLLPFSTLRNLLLFLAQGASIYTSLEDGCPHYIYIFIYIEEDHHLLPLNKSPNDAS